MGKGLPPVEFLGSTSEMSVHLQASTPGHGIQTPLPVKLVLELLRGVLYSDRLGLNPSSVTTCVIEQSMSLPQPSDFRDCRCV